MRLPPRHGWWLFAAFAVACGPQVEVEDGGETEGDETEGPDAASATGPSDPTRADESGSTGDVDPTGPDSTTGPAIPTSNAVDILLVVDNSGSMGTVQARLVASIGVLVDLLDAAGADWRIGITTTDDGNAWCEGTSPEGGNLVASSCRSRTQNFVFMGAVFLDVTPEACLDVCPEEWSDIELAEPWIAKSGATTNLPPGLDATQALRCIVPQGINGCGFESQLESMYKALRRSTTEGEASFGFLRPEAVLGVLVVSDEVDCSVNPDHETIFMPDGNRVFWADPSLSAPTSAVCWNAGVACTGGPGTYDECHAVDLDVNAGELSPQAAEDDAVLRPVARYTAYLQAIEDAKRQLNPGAEVLFAVLGGFGSDGTTTYADALDQQQAIDFGVAHGCQDGDVRALPPVRMRDVADAMGAGSYPAKHSLCDADYSGAFEAFGKAIAEHLP